MLKISLLLLIGVASCLSHNSNPVLVTQFIDAAISGSQLEDISDSQVYVNFLNNFCVNFTNPHFRSLQQKCDDFKEKIPLVFALKNGGFSNQQIYSVMIPQISARTLTSKQENSLLCFGCKAVIAVVKFDLLTLKMSADKIKAAIEFLCDKIAPLHIQDELCHVIVDYIDEIIQKIIDGSTPGNICVELKLCNSTTNVFKQKETAHFVKKVNLKTSWVEKSDEKDYGDRGFEKDGDLQAKEEEGDENDENEYSSFDLSPQEYHELDFEKHTSEIGEGLFKNVFGSNMFGDKLKSSETKGQNIASKIPDFKDLVDGIGSHIIGDFFKFPGLQELPKTFEQVAKTAVKKFEKVTTVFNSITKSTDKGECSTCKSTVNFVSWAMTQVGDIHTQVMTLCDIYERDEVCLQIRNGLDEIMRLIKGNGTAENICAKMNFCDTTSNQSGIIVPPPNTGNCGSLCRFMKGLYHGDVLKTMNLWNSTKEKLMFFCKENNIKCARLFYIFAKAERQLSALIFTEGSVADGCECFSKQSVSEAKNNPCQLCEQLERGLKNEIKRSNETMMWLASNIEEVCKLLPTVTEKCIRIAESFRKSFIQFEDGFMSKDICKIVGLCAKSDNVGVESLLKSITGLMIDIDPMKSIKSNASCSFCKTCMASLDRTFSVIGDTENSLPAVKERFEFFCHNTSDGKGWRSIICKQVKDGITTKLIVRSDEDRERTCKSLGIC